MLLVSMPCMAAGADATYVAIPAGTFRSALKYEDTSAVRVPAFRLMKTPVTNAQFLAFVRAHPQWQKGRTPRVFAEPRYLAHWAGPLALGHAQPQQPVVNVSWFAADAYCKAQGARLPRWNEWEYVAAADELRRDARADPAWRERILRWYSHPAGSALPRVGLQSPNAYGISDIHGLVWEWTDDYNAMLVDGDNRNQGDPDKGKFCGAGALSMRDRQNYAVLMRVAMLSSLNGSDVTSSMGLRCAR